MAVSIEEMGPDAALRVETTHFTTTFLPFNLRLPVPSSAIFLHALQSSVPSALMEAEGAEPAASAMCGDAMEAAGSPNRRSRRLHYFSKNWADFCGVDSTREDDQSGGKRQSDNEF